MTKRIVILGAGTAGTMMANKLARALTPERWAVTVIDRDDQHLYQPGLIFLPFGQARDKDLVRPRSRQLDGAVECVLREIDKVDPAEQKVYLQGAAPIAYDILIVATGSRIVPEETEGLAGPGWHQTAFDFYTLEGARHLAAALERFEGGRIVINVAEMPIKCPVAPLELTFLTHAYLDRRGLRSKTELVFATPLDGAFTKPKASAMLGELMTRRDIRVETDFNLAKVDGDKRIAESYDGRQLDYDLLVSIPVHRGAAAIDRSGLGDDFGWVPTDKHTLQTKAFDNVFCLGDATDLPSSKAGSVAHFQGDVLIANVLHFIREEPLRPDFDGHANCFIETGHDRAVLIDFNYTTEPLPGRFPLPVLGPFTLLEESRVNHWGKLAFEWMYWNIMLEGKELPLDHRMLMTGKWS